MESMLVFQKRQRHFINDHFCIGPAPLAMRYLEITNMLTLGSLNIMGTDRLTNQFHILLL